MSSESQARFVAKCKCGAKLKVPVSAAGRKARCPKCENIFVIPAPKIKKPVEVEPIKDPFEDGTFGLEELAAMERSAPALEPSSRGVAKQPCPKCNTMLDGGVMLCVSCGYNRETGKTVKGARTKPSKIASLSKASGKFMLGTIFSGIAALVGASVWFGIAMAADYQIGWIAWGIGGLCGYGMLKGYGKANMRAGLVASGMSVFGIFLAKIALFVFIIQAVFTGNTNNVDLQRQFIAVQYTNEIFDERGIYDLKERERLWEETFPQGLKKAVAMNDDEIGKRTNRLRAEADNLTYMTEESFEDKQIRIMRHRVDIEAEALGLYWSNSRREFLLDNAYDEISKYSPQETESALSDIKNWQETHRWADASYVHHHLTNLCASTKISDKSAQEIAAGNEDWESNERQWKTFHGQCSQEIEKLSGEARIAQLRKIETDESFEYIPEMLAEHYSDLRAQQEGLSFTNEKRSTIYDEEFEKFSAMSHEELDKENKKYEGWNEGDMWHDAAYVYTTLIYDFVDEEVSSRREQHEDEEDYWSPSESEWQSIYADATKKVDDIPAHQYKTKIDEIRAARIEKYTLAWQQQDEELPSSEEVADFADDAFMLFTQSMWSPMDGLFLLLAVSSAYKIANGGGETD